MAPPLTKYNRRPFLRARRTAGPGAIWPPAAARVNRRIPLITTPQTGAGTGRGVCYLSSACRSVRRTMWPCAIAMADGDTNQLDQLYARSMRWTQITPQGLRF